MLFLFSNGSFESQITCGQSACELGPILMNKELVCNPNCEIKRSAPEKCGNFHYKIFYDPNMIKTVIPKIICIDTPNGPKRKIIVGSIEFKATTYCNGEECPEVK